MAYDVPKPYQSIFPKKGQDSKSKIDLAEPPRNHIPRTGLYPATEIVEPYPRIDVVDFVRIEDGAQLE